MTIKDFFNRYHLSIREFSRIFDIPESTLGDILSGNSDIRYCQVETLNKLAKAFAMSIDEIITLEPILPIDMPNPSFATEHEFDCPNSFRALREDLLKEVRIKGECEFLFDILRSELVESCYIMEDYACALYLIGLLDYFAAKNGYLRITRFDRYRGEMMKNIIYAPAAKPLRNVTGDTLIGAIPQLLKFSFLETPQTILIP